jgi:hypothetical protein
MEKSYWEGTGTFEGLNKALGQMIPVAGPVNDPMHNRALEKFRKASNCYYDLFNNGLCNRAAEFRRVFGFGGTSIVKSNYVDIRGLENKMDEIILKAAREQNLPI